MRQILALPANLAWLRQALEANASLAPADFCTLACGHFGFCGKDGTPRSGELGALLKDMERQGLLCLPKADAGRKADAPSPSPLRDQSVPSSGQSGLPESAGAAGESRDARSGVPGSDEAAAEPGGVQAGLPALPDGACAAGESRDAESGVPGSGEAVAESGGAQAGLPALPDGACAAGESRDAESGVPGSGEAAAEPGGAQAGLPALPDGACAARERQGLRLVKVETQAQRQIWEEAMRRDQRRDGGPEPIGKSQVRYLAYADGKLAAAAGFCQASLLVGDRDKWLGVSLDERWHGLEGALVWMFCFFVRRGAQGPERTALAAIGAMLDAVREDWRQISGTEPLLAEIHAEPASPEDEFCRAACWIKTGERELRRVNGQLRLVPAERRIVYVQPLVPAFWERLEARCAPFRTPPAWGQAAPLPPWEGLEEECWAESEFGDVKVGRLARMDILPECAGLLFQSSSMSAEEAFGLNLAAQRAWYKLADSKDATPEALLSCHAGRTLRRAKALKTVLFLQAPLNVSFEDRPDPSDFRWMLKVLGNGLGPGVRGMPVLASAAVDPSGGHFLGIAKTWFCTGQGEGNALRELCRFSDQAARDMPATLAVTVCSSCSLEAEAALLGACRELRRSRLVFRVREGLVLPGASKALGTLMAQTPPCGTMRLAPRLLDWRNGDAGTAGWMPQDPAPQDPVEVDLAVRHVFLPALPNWPEVRLACIKASMPRRSGKPGRDALLLLTTLSVEQTADARKVAGFYARRGKVDAWIGLLEKTIRTIDAKALKTAWRFKNVLTVSMVVAWRKTQEPRPAEPALPSPERRERPPKSSRWWRPRRRKPAAGGQAP